MNLYLRLLLVLIRSFFKKNITKEDMTNEITIMVLPNDLDFNFHMTNSRYFAVSDLASIDFFLRSKLASVMLKKKWQPVLYSHNLTFKKSLKVFQLCKIKMKVSHWDDKYFYNQFEFCRNGRTIAFGQSKAVIRSKQGVIKPVDVMAAIEEHISKKDALAAD